MESVNIDQLNGLAYSDGLSSLHAPIVFVFSHCSFQFIPCLSYDAFTHCQITIYSYLTVISGLINQMLVPCLLGKQPPL